MIRYARLGYIALNVSDLVRSGDFYRDTLGLEEVRSEQAGTRLFRCSDQHHDIALFAGEPGVKRIAFELESPAQIDNLMGSLDRAGVGHVPIPEGDRAAMATGPGVRTWEPAGGCTLDFFVAEAAQRPAVPYRPTVAKILRLGHIVIASPDYERSLAFFLDTLNFKASDSFEGAVTFLRCFPNPYHHSFGIGAAGRHGPGLRHVAFMVEDMDDIGKSYWRLQKAGVPIVHGPGRHLPSGSVFLYFLDPDGMTIEYTLGMEEFPEVAPRPPRALPMVPESNDIWGSAIDKRKGTVGRIEADADRPAG
ncbi:2,3-dihydroxy-p-cumate-3,4-dioxygenase [Verticiella sediminum]|uniref:2,3-dihydroxy-p-cumate-3,4-dioxygenase n=1 Tax=Verticiella sediminum TaxID=1247510 RepID=A0A556ANR7_9BURK|nr:VOC family protein [Verticiella sediminum]TSH94525.1 2,3-dihydroxy-p-cumate-3,4-dioxygenase [Verticiella sediminum]